MLSFAKFAEKLLPGLGMVAGAAAFVSHTQKLQKAPDIGLGGRCWGMR